MKVHVDGKLVVELNETKKKVIKNDILEDIFQQDMERRVNWVLSHKYERCFDRLKREWEPKLKDRLSSIPTDPDALAEIIFSQSDYKSRAMRDKEEEIANRRQ